MARASYLLLALGTAIPAFAKEAAGPRYWSSFTPMPIAFDYVSGEVRDGEKWLWLVYNDPKQDGRRIAITQPVSEGKTGPARVAFTTDLIADFPDWQRPGESARIVNLSRTACYNYGDRGYVWLASAFAGSSYRPGQHPLLPVLFSSPTGAEGSWTYHGRLRGEPLTMERERRIWSDNGGIVPLPDGRWRIYLNGYGVTLAACEADNLDGPWHFLRTADGTLRNLVEGFAPVDRQNAAGIFPFVLRVSDSEFHLWLSQDWPVAAVWHFSSADGLDFRPYGLQPEILRADIGTQMKGIRAFLSADGQTIHGWIPFLHQGRWQIHAASMPTGLQPASE